MAESPEVETDGTWRGLTGAIPRNTDWIHYTGLLAANVDPMKQRESLSKAGVVGSPAGTAGGAAAGTSTSSLPRATLLPSNSIGPAAPIGTTGRAASGEADATSPSKQQPEVTRICLRP